MSGLKISAILLAAGLSSRMGEDKLLLVYDGKTFLQRALDLLAELSVYERILVTTAGRLSKVARAPGVKVELNPLPEAGQSGSVKLGITAATGNCYLFMTADQPMLKAADLQPLLERAKEASSRSNAKIIYPEINGNPCMPCLFTSDFREELLTIEGDTGGRAVRIKFPEACEVIKPESPENFIDIDDFKDYKNLKTIN